MANVVLPFDGDFDTLRRTLARWGWQIGERPNAPVFASGPGVTLHAYNTRKILISGARAAEYADALRAEGIGQARPSSSSSSSPSSSSSSSPPTSPHPPPEPSPFTAGSGWLLHFDGACLPKNPGGVAAYGFVVHHDGKLVHEGHGLAAPPGGGATNNVAEFFGLIEGLRWIQSRARRGEPIRVRGDSLLVIQSVAGLKNIRALHLKPLHLQAQELVQALGAKLEWVPREKNADADRLSEIGAAEAIRAHPEWGLR